MNKENLLKKTPMPSPGKVKAILLILGAWFLVNLLQAAFTGLFDDEALFWLYGERLNWGYYEHPPMVGLMIRAGYELIHNEFGLRLFFVIASTVSLYLLMILAGVKNYLLFASLIFAALIMHIGGFIAAPDIPLMLFILLFFLVYKKYLENDSVWISILWGFIMACMIYSKYNGILVIFFTILSNLKLLKKRSFYLAALSAILFFVPHIIWSFQNDHPTIYYHLIERTFDKPDHFRYFYEFILGQVGIYGPLVSLFFFWFSFTYKTTNLFERSLKFSAVGILLFFLIYTFRGPVESNWTLPAFMPMIILTYKAMESKIRLHKTVTYLSLASVILFIFFRIYLVYDFLGLPRKTINLSELHYWDEWAQVMEKKAEGRPVVVLNSYQRASKYSFYTNKTAHSLDQFDNHRTQFHYWSDLEKNLQGKKVFIIQFMSWVQIPGGESYTGRNGITTYYGYSDRFVSYYHVPLKIMNHELKFPAGSEVNIPVRIINPDKHPLRFDLDTNQRSWLTYHLFKNEAFLIEQKPVTDITSMVIPGAYADTSITIKTPDKPGKYYFWVSIKTGWLPSARNDNIHEIEIY